ncbi:DUF1707 domain-containing protein [Nocardia panacis]|uniref:DUF1707 domain-containing protein n=1 Tax=Nocardia panacis TaxID=2340916 RepID=A0A3A4KB17_9NOCA|nr:DUF1707 domain-containing protein [Nocardia panacis]RJO72278.1 DUF1707 domain-containing protein [Nocardia panacis]
MSEVPEIRIGTVEREDALRRLSDHFAAGRLSMAEFDERSGQVAAALTRGDLEKPFQDLPEPTAAKAVAPKSRRFPVGTPERVMPLIIIAAIILFFVTHTWLWFLAIPAASALLYGGQHNHRRHDRRDRRNRGRARPESDNA